VEEPGHDAVSPFGDASDGGGPADASGAKPAPIVLGETPGLGVGAGQQTLAQQAQANMPLEMAPAAGTMLTGSVASVGGQVWGDGTSGPDSGSFWRGMARTCIFGFVIMLLTFGTFMWAEGGYEWHYERVQVSWTDESRTDGSFTLPNAPIEECSLWMYNQWDIQVDNELWEINADCDGTLEVGYEVEVGQFSTSGNNANLSIIFQQPPVNGSDVGARMEAWDGGKYGYITQTRSTIGDGVSTEFTFQFDISEFQRCTFSVYAWSGNQEVDTGIDDWGYNTPNCPTRTLTTNVWENAGFIDFDTGYGEFDLSSSAPEDLDLWAEYEEEYRSGGFVREIAPCFGLLAALGLSITWLVQVVNAYKGGKSSKGNGMLFGVVPAFVMMVVFQIAFIILFEF